MNFGLRAAASRARGWKRLGPGSHLATKQYALGEGQIAEPRFGGTLEILRTATLDIFSDQTRNGPGRVQQHQRPAADGKIASDRPREPHEILELPAVDELQHRGEAFGHAPRQEYEWMDLILQCAPQAHAAEAGMRCEQVEFTGQRRIVRSADAIHRNDADQRRSSIEQRKVSCWPLQYRISPCASIIARVWGAGEN